MIQFKFIKIALLVSATIFTIIIGLCLGLWNLFEGKFFIAVPILFVICTIVITLVIADLNRRGYL